MKLLVVTNLYPLPWEPNRATFNKQQFARLAKNNQLLLLVLVPWLDAIKNRHLMAQQAHEGIELKFVPYFFIPKLFRFSYSAFVLLSLLTNFPRILRFKPDGLLASWAFPDGVAATLLGNLLNIPVVLKVHGSDINEYLHFFLRKVQILWAISRAHKVMAVSKALKEKLVKSGVPTTKIEVIYNGIDKSIFFPGNYAAACEMLGLDENRKRILFVGNLKKDKGCLALLEGFRELVVSDTSVDLCFIGQGACKAELQEASREAGLRGRVHLLGVMNQKEIANWMRASSVVALPSKNEGVPNVLLEAMACGLPVVATSVGGIPEVVAASSGYLSEYGDNKALIENLKKAVQQTHDREKIAESVMAVDWTENVMQVEKLFRRDDKLL
jgi:glycosyltransferase involved in cell wall biosynthesis